MFGIIFLHQIFSLICFCLQDLIKIVRLLLAAMSINGLSSLVGGEGRAVGEMSRVM